MEIKTEEIPILVRMALFEQDPSQEKPSPERLLTVQKRVAALLEKHSHDSREQFEKWFFGPNNTVLKEVAQMTDEQGGRLTLQEVRQAFLELGWQAYEVVGERLDFFMKAIKSLIPRPLTEEERRLFEHMHESQPYYGNLPVCYWPNDLTTWPRPS